MPTVYYYSLKHCHSSWPLPTQTTPVNQCKVSPSYWHHSLSIPAMPNADWIKSLFFATASHAPTSHAACLGFITEVRRSIFILAKSNPSVNAFCTLVEYQWLNALFSEALKSLLMLSPVAVTCQCMMLVQTQLQCCCLLVVATTVDLCVQRRRQKYIELSGHVIWVGEIPAADLCRGQWFLST